MTTTGGEGEFTERVVRLASIVAIDVVGFSAMSEKDQKRTANKIETLRARIEGVAAKNEGRVFNTAGDGFMLEFSSAGAALGAINALLDNRPKREPAIRVGAHVGDVVVTLTNDLLGHGVNVAARLQSLAPPNTALVSGEFRSMARNSPSAVFQSKGRQPLENIDQRVATFAIISQRQRTMQMLSRGAKGFAAASMLTLLVVFAGPPLVRYVDEQDIFAKMKLGDASASSTEVAAPAPAPAPIEATTPPPAAAAAAPALAPLLQAGAKIKDCETCPELIVAPGGSFAMGSPAREPGRFATEGPQHDVTVKPFAIGIHEVTFAEWDACLAGGGCGGVSPPDYGWGRGRRPVIGVSWADAQAYVQWLNREAGHPRYRLPTEAEWEYAARAGTATRYAYGDQITAAQGKFASNRTDPVGSYAANAYGLYDVHGNAWEWVADCYAPSYAGAPADGSAVAPERCTQRVYRGGGYRDRNTVLRVANRRRAASALRDSTIGFRVARDLE